jgi:bifunctional non-homologous end joining protein LigD
MPRALATGLVTVRFFTRNSARSREVRQRTPDFRALHSGNTQEILCVWAFDLMELNGEDLRPMPLTTRKRKLELTLRRHDHPYVRCTEPFKNGEQLLAECRQRGLEGIVWKRKHSACKSGKCDWVKGEVRAVEG